MEISTKHGVIATVVIAVVAGVFTLGKLSSDDTVKQLEKSIASYEKSDKLNTEEFITTAISTISELKLSGIERKTFNSNKQLIIDIEKKIVTQESSIGRLKEDISNQLAAKTEMLNSRLEFYEASKLDFSLQKGEGINLKGGLIQVGYSNDHTSRNLCDISINNKKLEMSSGEFVDVENCKVTLTQCVYSYPAKSAKFELVCFE